MIDVNSDLWLESPIPIEIPCPFGPVFWRCQWQLQLATSTSMMPSSTTKKNKSPASWRRTMPSLLLAQQQNDFTRIQVQRQDNDIAASVTRKLAANSNENRVTADNQRRWWKHTTIDWRIAVKTRPGNTGESTHNTHSYCAPHAWNPARPP